MRPGHTLECQPYHTRPSVLSDVAGIPTCAVRPYTIQPLIVMFNCEPKIWFNILQNYERHLNHYRASHKNGSGAFEGNSLKL